MIDQAGRRIGVYGLAVRHEAVLLARVARGYPSAGAWTLPGGGMEWGESPEQTLLREFAEETGLRPLDAVPLNLYAEVVRAPGGREVHSLQLVYVVTADGTPRPEAGGSTDQARWHGLDRLPEVVALVDRALSRVSVQCPPP